jgi:hypothetical protein
MKQISSLFLFSKPAKVEEILSNKNEIKIDSVLTYTSINQSSNNFAIAGYQTSCALFNQFNLYEHQEDVFKNLV